MGRWFRGIRGSVRKDMLRLSSLRVGWEISLRLFRGVRRRFLTPALAPRRPRCSHGLNTYRCSPSRPVNRSRNFTVFNYKSIQKWSIARSWRRTERARNCARWNILIRGILRPVSWARRSQRQPCCTSCSTQILLSTGTFSTVIWAGRCILWLKWWIYPSKSTSRWSEHRWVS